jgi:hypothetical protein
MRATSTLTSCSLSSNFIVSWRPTMLGARPLTARAVLKKQKADDGKSDERFSSTPEDRFDSCLFLALFAPLL